MKRLTLWAMLCLAYSISAQTPINLQLQGQGASHPPISGAWPVCQGNTISISTNWTAGAACAPRYRWIYPGSSASNPFVQAPIQPLVVSNFGYSNMGMYQLEIDCDNDQFADYVGTLFLFLAPNPDVEIRQAEDICLPAAAPVLQASGAFSVFSGNCSACDTVTGFRWWLSNPATGQIDTLLFMGNSFALSPSLLGPLGISNTAPTPLQVHFRATDFWGCVWYAPTVGIQVNPPFTQFDVVPDTVVLGITNIPIDLTDGVTGNLTGFAVNAIGAQHGLCLGSDYYPMTPGTEVLQLQAQRQHCHYIATDTFTIEEVTNFDFNNLNHSTLAWEACPGDSVAFTYAGIYPPRYLQFSRKGGGSVLVELEHCNNGCLQLPHTPTTPLFQTQLAGDTVVLSPQKGWTILAENRVRCLIPEDAITGTVCFYGQDPTTGISPLACLSASQLLTIHNPEVGFAVAKNPICYSDNVALMGIPAGGVFLAEQAELDIQTGLPSGSFSPAPALLYTTANGQVYLDGSAMQTQAAYNDGGQSLRLRYLYRPSYSDGGACPQPIVAVDTVALYDNRAVSFSLPLLHYDPQAQPLPLNQAAANISPQPIFAQPNDYRFSGTFVQSNPLPQPHDNFLTAVAGMGQFPVGLELDNHGCRIDGEAQLRILPAPEFVGLPGALCRSADTILFQRTSPYRYRYERDTLISCTPELMTQAGLRAFMFQCDPVAVEDVEQFRFAALQVFAADPRLHSNLTPIAQLLPTGVSMPLDALSIAQMNTAAEQLGIHLQHPIFNNQNLLYVRLLLQSSRQTCPVVGTVTGNNPYSFSLGACQPPVSQTIEIVQAMQIMHNGAISIDSLPQQLCYNSAPFSIASTPDFETGFSFFTIRPLNGVQLDTLYQDQLDITQFFNNNLNSPYEIQYHYHQYYGCDSLASQTIEVIAPQPLAFVGNTIGTQTDICWNAPEELFSALPSPTSGQGGSFSGAGMGVDNQGNPAINALFSPRQAGIGTHLLTYSYTDAAGCVSSLTRAITVRPSPNVQLQSSEPDATYCADVENAALIGLPAGGQYSGATIVGDSIFHPRLVYLLDSATAGGGVETYYRYADAFGCSAMDTLRLYVQPLPLLQMAGLAPRYCANAALVQNLQGSDLTGLSALSDGFFGDGILAGTRHYSPQQAGAGWDSIYYHRTNIYGCSDTLLWRVWIDTVPVPIIANLDTAYCINAPAVSLQVLPAGGIFSGLGLFQSGNATFFNPAAAAAQAGLGEQLLRYSYTDGQGCTGTTTDTVRLLSLPTASFSMASYYCKNDPTDTLEIVGSGYASAYFTGAGIVNSLPGRLDPSQAVSGLNTVSLHLQNVEGCQNTLQQVFLLRDLPVVEWMGVAEAYCSNADATSLRGYPAATILPTGASLQGQPYAHFHYNSPAFSVTNATTAQARFDPQQAALGQHRFIYEYTDVHGCSHADTAWTQVIAAPAPLLQNLLPQYCETEDTFLLAGSPMNGTFSGAGTQNGTPFFMPFRAGAGTHVIAYTVQETHSLSSGNALLCSETTQQTTTVYPLPVPRILAPTTNSSFCENETALALQGGITLAATLASEHFSGTGIRYEIALDTQFLPPWGMVFTLDTGYVFDPQLAGAGTHTIRYHATNLFGCSDSTTATYTVYAQPQPAFALPAVFCESDAAYPLAGSPAPGLFYQNGQVLTTPFYRPNPLYPAQPLAQSKRDTLVYQVSNAQCTGRDTQYVTVHPVPPLFFTASLEGNPTDRACIGGDTLVLQPNVAGGQFSGNGVLYGSSLWLPSLAGVGAHRIYYQYTDSNTLCANTVTDTFFSFNTPNVELEAQGTCLGDAIVLQTDSAQLNLFGQFQGALYDQPTTIRWDLGDGTIRSGNVSNENVPDTIHHFYQSADAYWVSLYVENQGLCADSDTLRLVVSPHWTPEATQPYSEDFENSAGGWIEEAESGGSSSDLWEWGIAQKPNLNTSALYPHHRVWTTHLDQVYGDESGWVYSPCFDLSQLERPMLSLDYFLDTDAGNDGAVIEYYDPVQARWLPLGEVGRGWNWYNRSVIAGRPGEQELAPIGWSGELEDWTTGRYALDAFRNMQPFRFRIAFGAVGVHNRQLAGFSFDNIWIGNRSRNVLLEHFANVQFPSMNYHNQLIYNQVFHPDHVRDLVLIQYQTDYAYDEINRENPVDANTRELYYGVSAPAQVVLNGRQTRPSAALTDLDWEEARLQTPRFELEIDQFHINTNDQTVTATARLIANEALPTAQYNLQLVLVEDSLDYEQTYIPTQIQSAMRAMLPDATGTPFTQDWYANETAQVTQQWQYDPYRHQPQRLELVAFVQNEHTKEVYQATCSRDLTVFLGTNAMNEQATVLEQVRLYPNPAQARFTVDWSQALERDYTWRVIDLRGIELARGVAAAGSQSFEVETQDWPAGMYFLIMGDAQVLVQRKVVIFR